MSLGYACRAKANAKLIFAWMISSTCSREVKAEELLSYFSSGEKWLVTLLPRVHITSETFGSSILEP